MIRFETIRLAIYYAVQHQWKIQHFDVKTAFLHDELEEDIFMEQPADYSSETQKVVKLCKSLYGLRQAPHMWNKMLHTTLAAFRFERLESDYGV